MSFDQIPIETHQGSRTTTEWPKGIIRRIQPQQAHEDFLKSLDGDDTVMMKITDVEALLRARGEVRDTYFPSDTTVITTGIVHDNKLKQLSWARELNAVKAFQPDFHIPTDYPVYGDMPRSERIENIEKMMEGTRWAVNQLWDTDIQVIPLIKGYSQEERAICYDTINRVDTEYCAYYGAQYFGGEMGNGILKLTRDIRSVVSELSVDGLMVIGLQSMNGLDRMPPEVVAAAGQRWIYQSNLRDTSLADSVRQYRDWKHRAEQELEGGQTTLGSFAADSNEVMVHG